MAKVIQLHQMHANCVPHEAYRAIRHQAVDLDLTPSRWLSIIITYIAARPSTAQEIYETFMNTNGHADTSPEMEAVRL